MLLSFSAKYRRGWPVRTVLSYAVLSSAVLLMFGCSRPELLVKVPVNAGNVSIAPYNTATHKNSIALFSPLPLQKKIEQQKLLQRADNLFVLFDNGSVMQEDYRGMSRYEYGVEILGRFHQTLPVMSLQGNVFKTSAYGHATVLGRFLSADNSREGEVPGIESYVPTRMQQRVEDTTAGHIGDGGLDSAITGMSDLITATGQPTVLLMVTRWERIDEKALVALARLRQKLMLEHEQELCVFTVGVGNNFSRARFDQPEGCGNSVSADTIAQPRGMSHFIERMFFYGPADSDNDGIYDYRDECPDTAAGRLVRFNGCNRFGAVLPAGTGALSMDLQKAYALSGNEDGE